MLTVVQVYTHLGSKHTGVMAALTGHTCVVLTVLSTHCCFIPASDKQDKIYVYNL